jgi:hypothetical protein
MYKVLLDPKTDKLLIVSICNGKYNTSWFTATEYDEMYMSQQQCITKYQDLKLVVLGIHKTLPEITASYPEYLI